MEKKQPQMTFRQLNEAFYNAKFSTFRFKRKGNQVWIYGEMQDRPRIDVDKVLFNVEPTSMNV